MRPLYFILAPSYHGAGMLSWRLNHHPDILSFGTGNPPRNSDQPCSCGERLRECQFWGNLLNDLGLQEEQPFPGYLPSMPQIVSNQRINKTLNSFMSLAANEVSPKCWKAVYEPAERFYFYYDNFMSAARECYPYKAYVDAERSNLKFMTMASMDFPVQGVIHITRDPRGYAAARRKYYPEIPLETLALEWVSAHTRIARLKTMFAKIPFHRVAYESLLEDPHGSMRSVTDFMGLNIAHPEELIMDPGKNHMVGLAPADSEGGFEKGGDNWRDSLHFEDSTRVLKAAGPLFSEFGYKA
jgi:hypothetical protein